ncbi:aspartate carbamoyltransferase [Candidatus Woesearchaeota archaeon]|nr:aspartate carbamoyltransferase [Candidatus Woesearchaeota archaeon]
MISERRKSRFFARDWLDVHSITRSELEYLISLSSRMKSAIEREMQDVYCLAKGHDLLAALLFYEPSTRTRTSFEIAAMRLGLRTTGFSGTEATSVKKGECLTDTVSMYAAYNVAAVIMRHPLDGSAKAVSEYFRMMGKDIPAFNGGDGKHEHPTQAILDAFTINECCGRLEDLDIGIAVDARYGRTAHSLPVVLSLFPGNRFHIFTHELLRMPPAVLKFLDLNGVEYHEYTESREQLEDMLGSLDFLYMTRIQRERLPDDDTFYKAKDMFRFTPDMMGRTKGNFGIGHPLPENKENPSIDPSLRRHPKYWATRQAGNGVPTRLVELALSLGLAGSDFDGDVFVQRGRSGAFYTERTPGGRKETGPYDIRPIMNGTVIDHVENDPYAVARLAQLLKLRESGNIYRLGVVEPRDRPDVIKGVLMIRDRYLSDDEVRLVATISPGATVNDIRERNVVRKRDLVLPEVIDGLPNMRCTNAGCITRPEHQEYVASKAVKVGEGRTNLVNCCYCGNLMESQDMF